jgi:hypothetical protein
MARALDADRDERLGRANRLADLARRLGVDLLPLRGPSVAFDPAPGRSPGAPVFLGGDLHAVHPAAPMPHAPPDRDGTLDQAASVKATFTHPAVGPDG